MKNKLFPFALLVSFFVGCLRPSPNDPASQSIEAKLNLFGNWNSTSAPTIDQAKSGYTPTHINFTDSIYKKVSSRCRLACGNCGSNPNPGMLCYKKYETGKWKIDADTIYFRDVYFTESAATFEMENMIPSSDYHLNFSISIKNDSLWMSSEVHYENAAIIQQYDTLFTFEQ